jgi:signal transduction histidine kinase
MPITEDGDVVALLYLNQAIARAWTEEDVDPTRFAQSLANLLQNAAKFTPPGDRIILDASMDRDCPDAPNLIIRVTDSGEGIPAPMLPRIFDLFAQAKTSGQSRHSRLGNGDQ